MSLFVVKFSFIQDHVNKVFDGILVYDFHEGFGVSFVVLLAHIEREATNF
jgi:hypothetical protein